MKTRPITICAWSILAALTAAESNAADTRTLCDSSGCRTVDPRVQKRDSGKSPTPAPKYEDYRGESLVLLEQQAASGDANAAYKAGQVYALGLVGVKPDRDKAVRLLSAAADRGHTDAAFTAAKTLLATYLAPPPVPAPLPPPPAPPLPSAPPAATSPEMHAAPAPLSSAPTRTTAAEPVAQPPRMEPITPVAQAPKALPAVSPLPAPKPAVSPLEAQQAVRYLNQAADAGNLDASVLLGELLYKGDLVAADSGRASQLFERAAASGNADAQYYIGQMHFRGTGKPQNGFEAIRWTRMAATNGSVLAQRALGQLYLGGYENLPPDKREASRWLTAATQNGDPDSARLLKLMSEGGYIPKGQSLLSLLPVGDIVDAANATMRGIRESRERLARGELVAPVVTSWASDSPSASSAGQTTVTPLPAPVAARGGAQCWQVGHVGRQLGKEVRDEEIVCDSDIGIRNL
jgi:uncharacterized protein